MNCRPFGLLVLLSTLFVSGISQAQTSELEQINREIHGGDPLRPTPESLVGRYIAETGARALVRSFPNPTADNSNEPGVSRLFVSITRRSFPVFLNYFSNGHFLSHFHEPHQTILVSAFRNKRGDFGRLEDDFRFTYAGIVLMPIVLTQAESARAERFFSLAQQTPRWFDFALHPWLLKNAQGDSYVAQGDSSSLSDWFLNIPLGDPQAEPRITYDRDTVYADANSAKAPITDPNLYPLLESVWTAPQGHSSLGQVLNLGQIDVSKAGRTATALLGAAALNRLPIVFRYVDSHEDLTPEINLWIDP